MLGGQGPAYSICMKLSHQFPQPFIRKAQNAHVTPEDAGVKDKWYFLRLIKTHEFKTLPVANSKLCLYLQLGPFWDVYVHLYIFSAIVTRNTPFTALFRLLRTANSSKMGFNRGSITGLNLLLHEAEKKQTLFYNCFWQPCFWYFSWHDEGWFANGELLSWTTRNSHDKFWRVHICHRQIR